MNSSHSMRQKIVAGGIALLALLFLATAVAPVMAQAGATAVVNVASAPLRTGPGAGHPTTLTTFQGYALTMLARTPDSQWIRVRTSGNPIEGWISASSIATNGNIGALPVSDVPVLAHTAVITAGAVNLRLGDSTQFRSIATLGSGTQVALLGRNSAGSWVQVRVVNTGQTGWINATTQSVQNVGFLPVVAPPPLTDDTAEQAPSIPTGPYARVTAGNLNVRQGPGIGFARVASVSFQETVQMIGRAQNGPWVMIRTNAGVEGWVNSFYMQFSYDLNALPVMASGGTVTPPSQPNPPAVGDSHGTLRANVTLNVRQGPGLGFTAFGLLFSGHQAQMIGRSADSQWVRIRDANGTQGWVFAAYTTPSTAIANLPVVN